MQLIQKINQKDLTTPKEIFTISQQSAVSSQQSAVKGFLCSKLAIVLILQVLVINFFLS